MNYTKTLFIVALTLFTSLLFAEPVTLTLTDGTVWQGETGNPISLVVKKGRKKTTVEGTLTRNAGQFIVVTTTSRDQVIFLSDIESVSTETNSSTKAPEEIESTNDRAQTEPTPKIKPKAKPEAGKLTKGVFLLPLDGGVGEIIRSTEIRELAEHADQYGPGQILILDINSPGGSVLTGVQMRDLLYDIRKRHRVIAWVDRATSGGAFLSFCCDEIYFRRSSNFGSITMWSGNFQGAAEPEMNAWITQLEGVLAKSSRTPLFAAPMVVFAAQLSYDIDEKTGEITYFDTTEGEFVLSDGQSVEVLSITSEQAEHCGLSDGTADTLEELATLLNLDQWEEVDEEGRKLASTWKVTLEKAGVEIPELYGEFGGNVEARTNGERIMKQIKAGKALLSWAKKLGESAMNFGLDDGFLGGPDRIAAIKRQIKELEQQR
ncbi:MAG: hypothetical protein H8E91_05420 [Planctomycetes bacterium]|nr:hypothetical protein [Planctomycetota bacterium]